MSSDQQRQPEAGMAPEGEPLPPLPAGGLARSIPDWLRDQPPTADRPPARAIDPASLITADDLPDWLRQLGPEHHSSPASSPASPAVSATVPPPGEQPVAVSIPPAPPATLQPEPVPAPTVRPDQAIAPAPAIVSAPSVSAAPAPHRHSEPARRKAIVAALGFLLLALAVVAYVYARGGP